MGRVPRAVATLIAQDYAATDEAAQAQFDHLRFDDAAIDHFGEDLVFGQGDATATYTVVLGWTHPYSHTFVRPIISFGGRGDRAADVQRELDELLATSRAWGEAQITDFAPGLSRCSRPTPMRSRPRRSRSAGSVTCSAARSTPTCPPSTPR